MEFQPISYFWRATNEVITENKFLLYQRDLWLSLKCKQTCPVKQYLKFPQIQYWELVVYSAYKICPVNQDRIDPELSVPYIMFE